MSLVDAGGRERNGLKHKYVRVLHCEKQAQKSLSFNLWSRIYQRNVELWFLSGFL